MRAYIWHARALMDSPPGRFKLDQMSSFTVARKNPHRVFAARQAAQDGDRVRGQRDRMRFARLGVWNRPRRYLLIKLEVLPSCGQKLTLPRSNQ